METGKDIYDEYLGGEEWREEMESCWRLFEVVVEQELFCNGLKKAGATWVRSPEGAKVLDIGFVPETRENHEFLGVNVFARPNSVGVVFRPVEVPYEEVEQSLREDEELGPLMSQGARVVILTMEDLQNWIGFYAQVKAEGWHDILGDKALEYSGLGRTDWAYAARFAAAADDLLVANAQVFVERGVAHIDLPSKGKIDRAFVNAQGDVVGVVMHHVRVAELKGEILEEKVLSEGVLVPGLVVRRTGESKREAYERARNLARYWRRRLGEESLEVPVVSEGQLSIWRKLGMWSEVESAVVGSDLSTEEVIRFLYLGKSNLEPGELARMGYSLPSTGREFAGVDVVFLERGPVEERRVATIDGLLGLNLGRKKKDEEGFLALNRVSGIVILPDEWDVREMKSHVERIRYDLNYRTGGPDSHLLYLTRELFDRWRERGSIFADGEANGFASLRQRHEYGYGAINGGRSVGLHVWRPFPEIGGQKMAVVVDTGGDRVVNMIDWGTSFEAATPALRELTAKAPTSIGLRRQLETGELPMVLGAYDTEYILASIRKYPAILHMDSNNAVSSFLRAEIKRRVDFKDVERLVGEGNARRIYELAEQDERWWYGEREQIVSNLAISHAHVDHVGDVPFLDRRVVMWGTAETMAHLRAMTRRGKSWTNRYEYVSLVTQDKDGAAYRREYRDAYPTYWSGQRVRIGEGLAVEFSLANHSMTGMAMVGVRDEEGKGLMLYTGDVKPGNWTEKTVNRLAGEYPVIVMETTNLEDAAKPSSGVTEQMVRDTLLDRIREAGRDTVVVVAPANHLERLQSIGEVAEAVGRKVAIGPAHAELVEQMRADREMLAPLGVDGFDFWLPALGSEAALWWPTLMPDESEDELVWPQVTTPRRFQRNLFEIAMGGGMGVVDLERLSKEGQEWLVVIDPYRLFRHEFGGGWFGNGLSVLHSAHFPYQGYAKRFLAENTRWVGEQRGKHLMDFEVKGMGGRVVNQPNYGAGNMGGKKRYGLHASGHATFEEMVAILDGLVGGNFSGKKLVLVHGQSPERYERALRKRLGLDRTADLEIVSRMDRYDPKKPVSRNGWEMKLNGY